MRGRPPRPTKLLLLEGRRGRKANKQEPEPHQLLTLAPPEWLPEPAVAVWNEIAPKLRQASLLSTVDVHMLGMACQATAQYRLATIKIAELEAGPDAATGAAQISQWRIVQSMCFKQSMAVFQQFGMSPAARTRIAAQPQGDSPGAPPGGYFS